jgi:hypothetical protein
MTETMMVKKCAQWELRVVFHSLLEGAITLGGAVVPVFETIPKGMPLPYIALTGCRASNGDTKSSIEDDYVLDLEIFTDYGGTMNNVAILSAVYEVISDAWNTHTLQFPSDSDFCITMFWFGDEETILMAEAGLARRIKEELEASKLALMLRVRQLR